MSDNNNASRNLETTLTTTHQQNNKRVVRRVLRSKKKQKLSDTESVDLGSELLSSSDNDDGNNTNANNNNMATKAHIETPPKAPSVPPNQAPPKQAPPAPPAPRKQPQQQPSRFEGHPLKKYFNDEDIADLEREFATMDYDKSKKLINELEKTMERLTRSITAKESCRGSISATFGITHTAMANRFVREIQQIINEEIAQRELLESRICELNQQCAEYERNYDYHSY